MLRVFIQFLSFIVIMWLLLTYQKRLQFALEKAKLNYSQHFLSIYGQIAQDKQNISIKSVQLEGYCLEKDLNSLFHPDTIMSDIYLNNAYTDYPDKKKFVYKKGFPYFRFLIDYNKTESQTRHLTKWQGLKYTALDYDGWFSKYSCLFEKRMRMPIVRFTFEKTIMNEEQNHLIERLSQNNATEQCLKAAQLTKKGFTLSNKNECQEIFEILRKGDYNDHVVISKYLVKENKHEGTGVNILDQKFFNKLMKDFDNGERCGQKDLWKHTQIQEYIYNPLLLNGYVFVFRAYILVPTVKPVIVYLYDQTSLQLALFQWNNQTFSKRTHFCNNKFVKDYLKEKHIDIQSEEAQQLLKSKDLMLSYEQLNEQLIKQGSIKEGTSVYDSIISKVEEKLGIYFYDIMQIYEDSRFGQYSSIDFMFDVNLNLHYLEFNNKYNQEERYPERAQFFHKLHQSNINLTFRYIRNRYQRLKKFIQAEMTNLEKKTDNFRQKLNHVTTDILIQDGEKIENYIYLDLQKGRKVCSDFL